ncbi:MAG: chromosomal replication initiator protein DnaA [Phycisphaerae bacterium]|jgi:chromosomal replication initiator protein|nr:chromosomal replication initiator protein DnaA [Phycisphaerae bacterium]
MTAVNKNKEPNLSELWQRMLSHLRLHHSELVRNWFDELRIREFDRGHLVIAAPISTQHLYLKSNCTDAFIQTAQSITGRLVGVDFINLESADIPIATYKSSYDEQLMLNEEYIFESFVAGNCNKLAHAASIAVAREPGKRYNPLFIHGSVGLGKTHLLQAICHEILKNQPNTKIKYLSCETFINSFIEAVENGNVHEFRHRYRDVDLLVIDDVQFLANKDSSQEEFFHTFNSLYQAQKQIILSSDRPPSEIETLTERLISRFSWGLVAGIDRPCLETRMAIIKKKSKLKSMEIPEDVIAYMARAIDSNTRELEGAITKLQGLAMLDNSKITLQLAQQVIPKHLLVRQEITIDQIVEAVTKQFNVKVTELQSKRRNKTLALPRQVCMFLARQMTRWSLEEIGGYFGGRDHSTVLHAAKTIQKTLENDPSLRNTIETIARNLTGSTNSINMQTET